MEPSFPEKVSSQKFNYPYADRLSQYDDYFGNLVHDPYRWMEEMQSFKTKQWVRSQDSLLRNFLADPEGEKKISNRMTELTGYDNFSVPQRENNVSYYAKMDKDSSQADIYMQKNNEAPLKIFDHTLFPIPERELRAGGGFHGFLASPKGDMLLISVGKSNQSRWYEARIMSIKTGKILEDEITGLNIQGGTLVWSRDNLGFFYNRFQKPQDDNELNATISNPQVYYHKIGEPQTKDKLIYRGRDEGNSILTLKVSSDNKYLIIEDSKGSSVQNRVIVKDLQGGKENLKVFLNKDDASYSYICNQNDTFFFYSNLHAVNGRIIKVNLSRPNIITEVIGQQDEPIMGGSVVGGNILGYYGKHFVLGYVKNGLTYLKVYDQVGNFKYKVDLPIDGAIWGGLSGDENETSFYYQFLGFVSPSTIYKYDVHTKRNEIYKKAVIKFDTESYETKQVFFKGNTGVKTPMFVTYRKGLKLNGKNPLIMYGYGAFNWISFLWYQPHLLWWLENGGIYAQPSIRGGGEYGEDWHKAGIGKNRQNAIDDFNGAAEYLIREGYTSPALMVANGGSASAGMAGMAFLQRPDLYGAVVLDRSVFDFLRYHKFTTAATWVQEFGSSDVKDDFKHLYKLSPYYQVDSSKCYPPVLLMHGDNDQVAAPFHSYKFLAKLQAANPNCQNPFLLKTIINTGHSFGSTPEIINDARTIELMFLVKVLGLNVR